MSLERPQFNPDEVEKKHAFKEVWEMSYSEFLNEYERVMKAVSKKEKKGRLDPDSRPYELISSEEQTLLEKDWKEFSRKRGFSEEDIVEYERWLALSGQRDNLQSAVNDPWRRTRYNYEKQLYLKHIAKALTDGKTIPPEVMTAYTQLKKSVEEEEPNFGFADAPSAEIPTMLENSENQEDVW